MRRHLILIITVVTGVFGLALLLLQPSTASAGGNTTTTKVTYPTTTTKPHMTTTTQRVTTTTAHETTTTEHQTTTTEHQTTTTQKPITTTTQPITTTTEQETTTTEQPNLTILTLAAQVNGGTATLADFDLFANGPVSLAGITDSPGVTFAVVPPGFYALSDTQSPLAVSENYSTSGWDCVGTAETTPESATLDQGEDALCVITFTSQFAATTTTTPIATTTAPGATTAPPTTMVLSTGTTVAPSGTVPFVPTGEVQTVTPASEVPIPTTPEQVASSSLPFTGGDARLGLGSGLLLVTVGGIVLLLVRRRK